MEDEETFLGLDKLAQDTDAVAAADLVVEDDKAADPAPKDDVAVDGAAKAEPAADPAKEPESEQEPWYKKRIDSLTGKRNEERTAREAAEARAQALEALLTAQGVTVPEGQKTPAAPVPGAPKTYTEADIQAEARKIAAAQAFNQRCDAVFDDGVKAHGVKFEAAVRNLNTAGVTQDLTFLEAALETEAPADLINHLGNNPSEAIRIAELPPIKRAVEMDRLARQLKASAKRAPLSKTPAPIAPVGGNTPKDTVDLADENISIADFAAEFDKQLRARNA